ncbi:MULTISPECIES: hypothetical protein [Halococcus]|uniref:Uncharacterized protein n=1 Tax=Halococcus salifodinae DSM 8989 TaxID=1227456 RepID=M0NC17_9EURY|nr:MULTISPECIES: hypothetical protein [Halococcus]EMA55492.1 hypothetical protein C450_01959 [Halococcus salifodinae DSM 8989]
MVSPSVNDHVRSTDFDSPDGIYRVVGTVGESVTLLRVGTPDGRRVHTGEIITVSDDAFDEFEPVENPDGNRPFGAAIAAMLETSYWSVRVFARQLVVHPLPTVLAIVAIVAGALGEGAVSLPDVVFAGLLLAGSLGLAVVGSGRL